MTFGELRKKLINRWLVVAILIIVTNLVLLPRINQESYVASIGFGLNPSTQKTDDSLSAGNNGEGYGLVLEQLSLYISNRFSSIEIQSKIASELGFESNYKVESPFYDVNPQQAGFVSLTYSNPNKENAEKFFPATKTVYQQIINEWNSSRPEVYKIRAMKDFNQSVSVNSPTKQFQILPTLVGLLVGLAIILTIPLKSNKK